MESDNLPDSVPFTTPDGRILQIPNVDYWRGVVDESTPGSLEGEDAETAYYWDAAGEGFGEELYSLESGDGATLLSTSEEERIAFETSAPYFLLQWDSQGFVTGRFVSEREADRERADAEETRGPSDGDYILSDAGPLGSQTAVGVTGGDRLGTFEDRDSAERAIRKDAAYSRFYPGVWTLSDHGNLLLLRDFDFDGPTESDGERFVAAVEANLKGTEAYSVGSCPGCRECGLDSDSLPILGARVERADGGTIADSVRVADDGDGEVYLYCESLGPVGIVRARNFSDAWDAAVDAIMDDASESDVRNAAEDGAPLSEGELPEGFHWRPNGAPTRNGLSSAIAAEDPNGSCLARVHVDPRDPESGEAILPGYGTVRVVLNRGDVESARSMAEEGGFSHSSCDSCGSSLAGDRYPAHYWAGGELRHDTVCVDCLMFHANGDVPDRWEG